MKQKNVFKKHFVTTLLAILCCIVTFGSAVFSGFNVKAESKSQQPNNYEAAVVSDEDPTYELTSVTLTLTDGWFFTKNTPEEMLYKIVTVTVAYNNVKADRSEERRVGKECAC